jgi:hypothetical protein
VPWASTIRLAFFCIIATTPAATVARVAAEVELSGGGGRDNGLFPLAVEMPEGTATDDWFFEVRPTAGLLLGLGEAHELRLGYLGSYRRFVLRENGLAHAHLAHGSYGLALSSWLRLETSLLGAAEWFTAVESDYLVGGGSFGPALELGGLRLRVRGEAQWIESAALRAPLGGVWGSVGWHGRGWTVAATGRWRTDGAGWQQVSAGLSADVALEPFAGHAEVQGGSSSDSPWLAWTASLAGQVSPRWAIVGDYRGSALFPVASGAPILGHAGTLGVRFTWESVPAGIERLFAEVEGQRRAHASGGGLTLWVRTPPRTETVALRGELNDWGTTAMTPAGPGVWRLDLALPAGRYAVILLLDEQPCVPAGAPAYRDDAYGGRNAILVVGEVTTLELTCAFAHRPADS